MRKNTRPGWSDACWSMANGLIGKRLPAIMANSAWARSPARSVPCDHGVSPFAAHGFNCPPLLSDAPLPRHSPSGKIASFRDFSSIVRFAILPCRWHIPRIAVWPSALGGLGLFYRATIGERVHSVTSCGKNHRYQRSIKWGNAIVDRRHQGGVSAP